MDAPAPAPAPRPKAFLRVVGTAGGVVLAVVLLVAAATKVLDPDAFAEAIRAEHLDFLLSAKVVAFVALGFEVGLGVLLLTGVRRWWVMGASALLVAFFLVLTGRTYLLYMRGEVDPARSCGCFGHLVDRTPAEAFWEDLVLLLPALVVSFLGRPAPGPFPRRRAAAAGAVTVAALAFAAVSPRLDLDDLATRLKPGLGVDAVCAGKEERSRVCLLDVIPLLSEGRHVVVMADLEDPAFAKEVPRLNRYAVEGKGPLLWVMTEAPAAVHQRFALTHGASFRIQEAPAMLLRPLYRRLPRSFLVVDGRIQQTYRGLPPLSVLAGQPPG